MKIKLKQTMYQDLEDDTLYPYLYKIDYPFCREGEDYITWHAGSELTGCMFKGNLEIFIYPNILNDKLIIPESILNDYNYVEVVK